MNDDQIVSVSVTSPMGDKYRFPGVSYGTLKILRLEDGRIPSQPSLILINAHFSTFSILWEKIASIAIVWHEEDGGPQRKTIWRSPVPIAESQ